MITEVKEMKRIEVADALRGFSLFGIFIANLLIFQFGLTGQTFIEFYHLNSVNQGVYDFIKTIFENSFMPIFAILFGFSLDKLYQSMKLKELKRPRLKLFRRAIFLLIIGLVHSIYIWEGDILFGYSLSMLIIIPFISLGKRFFKWIAIIGLVLLFSMNALGLLDDEEVNISDKEKETYVEKVQHVFSNGTYTEIHNSDSTIKDPSLAYMKDELGDAVGLIFLFAFIMEAIFFVFGIYLSKAKWFEKDARLFWSSKLFIYLIPISILGKSSYLWIDNENISESLHGIFSMTLAFGMMCLFKYLYQKKSENIVLQGFKNLGKMSLTMYILQSVIGTLIFYSYGLGLFGKDILIFTIIIFIIVYICQMLLATWYQKNLRYGPLEYILRMFTYFKFKVRAKG